MENKNKEIIERIKKEILADFKNKIKILNANAPSAWYVNQLRTTLKKLDVLETIIQDATKHLEQIIQDRVHISVTKNPK